MVRFKIMGQGSYSRRTGGVKAVCCCDLFWMERLDIGFVPEAVPVNDGIPVPCRELIYDAREQQIIPFASFVAVIAIEVEAHSGNGHNFLNLQVLQSPMSKWMLPARPGTNIQIDASRRSIAVDHLMILSID